MHLIVGLGNPGASYGDTPHNAGFRVCEALADRHHLGPETKKFQGLLRRGRIKDLDVAVLRPQTYMNLSGDSVAEAIRYLPVESSDLLVICDELDLPAGRLRIRPKGGHAGHNGMRSVIERLGTRDFARMRIGVGRGAPGRDPTSHLLGRMRPEEREEFGETVEEAVRAVETILFEGVAVAMNRFNGPPPAPTSDETEEGAQ